MNFKEIEATQAMKFSFGKHSGRTVEDVYLRDTSYLEWMIAPSTNFNNKELVRKVKQYLEWKNAKPEPEKGSQHGIPMPAGQKDAMMDKLMERVANQNGVIEHYQQQKQQLRQMIHSKQTIIREKEATELSLRTELEELRAQIIQLVPFAEYYRQQKELEERLRLSTKDLTKVFSKIKLQEPVGQPKEEATQKK